MKTTRTLIGVLCIFLVACQQPKNSLEGRKAGLDSFTTYMNNKLKDLSESNFFDSARNYLNQLGDTVQKLNYDRLTFYWRLQNGQHFMVENRMDSASAYFKKASLLLGSKWMTYKDSFNFYAAEVYLLQKQNLIDSALRMGNAAYYLARNDSFRLINICYELAELYRKVDDLPNVRKYLFLALKYKDSAPELISEIAMLLLEYYNEMNQVDSCIYYLKIAQSFPGRISKQPGAVATLYENTALFLIGKGRLNDGFQNLLKAKKIYDSMGVKVGSFYNNLADSYGKVHEYEKALQYIDTSIVFAAQKEDYDLLSIAWQTKSEVLFKKKDYRKAYSALDSSYAYYSQEMDSSLRNHARELETKYAVREKDNQIRTLDLTNQANLKIRRQQRIIIIAIIAGTIFLGIIAILFWRRRQLQNQLREKNLREQVLRAQLDPHFLFNALSVLHNFIRTELTDKALGYLSNLAKLYRFIFENTRENTVLLKDEIEALKTYMDIQVIYRPGLFNYSMDLYNGYEDDEIYIPPMLLQPFVENAILHGFSGIDYEGLIKIKIEKRMNTLHCIIEDNGRGIRQNEQKRRTRSTMINEERLFILANQTRQNAKLTITEKKQANNEMGVRVEIEIPFRVTMSN